MANQGTPAPFIVFHEHTDAGAPAAGYKLFTYLAGTTTKADTFTDVGLTVPNANPIILDSAGRATIFMAPSSLKFVFTSPTDTDPPTSPIWTRDNIGAIPVTNVDLDIQGTAGEDLTAGQGVYLSAGDGGRTAGRWYLWDADNTYSSVTANALGMVPASIATGVAGSIRLVGRVTGLSALTAGTLYYVSATAGALTSSPPTNARPVGAADSITSVVLSQWIPVPTATATLPGILAANGAAQSLGGVYTFTTAPVFQALPTGLGMPVLARCTSNLTKNASTAFSDVTGVSFPVLANKTYIVDGALFYTSVAAADIKFTLTGPAAPTAVNFGIATADIIGRSTAFGSATAISTNATDTTAVFKAIIRNGANAGTVQLQMAQNASDASNTVCYADSFLSAVQMA